MENPQRRWGRWVRQPELPQLGGERGGSPPSRTDGERLNWDEHQIWT